MKLTKEFQTRLMALKRSGKKKQYEQAMMIISELGFDIQVSKNQRDDSRIPNCVKFELPDGYRIVFQEIEGKERDFLALFIGSHDEVDRFLDNHKGWIFDPDKQGLKELRWSTVDEERTNLVRSSELKKTVEGQTRQSLAPKAFEGLTTDRLLKAGVTPNGVDVALQLVDPDSPEVMTFLDSLDSRTQDVLLAYLTGNPSMKAEIVQLLDGNREFLPAITTSTAPAIDHSPEQFIDLRELPEEQKAFDSLPMDDWMLFLHPDQKQLVDKSFSGPARIRGVSGSGKTVVAIHRARYSAREIIREASNEFVLFLNFNRSLTELVSELLNKFCTPLEHSKIQVSTMDKWCRDYVCFRYGTLPSWNTQTMEQVWSAALKLSLQSLQQTGLAPEQGLESQDRWAQFLKDEVDFIFGKFLHNESQGYLTCDRRGRGVRLTNDQRKVILQLYTTYAESLLSHRQFIPRELNRNAYDLLTKDEPTEKQYSAIIVDEVQDLSEIELRVIHLLAQLSQADLILVGDGAQRIYVRGYSMRNLGINVVGRSFVLRKNYRNTREIIRAAVRLMSGEGIGKYDDDPEVAQAAAIESVHTGDNPLLMVAQNPTQEWDTVANEIRYLTTKAGIFHHEICCLARSRWQREGLKVALTKHGIASIDYQADGIVADNVIKISSLHNVKGHEFRAVFILGLFEGALPLAICTEPEDLEREAALLYVAMTRAKEMLYLSYPRVDQNGRKLTASRFLSHLGDSIDIIELPKPR